VTVDEEAVDKGLNGELRAREFMHVDQIDATRI
jgi:hypothetical protein